jgi:hypothetical protein
MIDTALHPELHSGTTCIAFSDGCKLAAGGLGEVALVMKAALEANPAQQILVFDAITSRPIDFDLRGDAAAILARLAPPSTQPAAETETAPVRPGRPKLGVVAREVTLLPRHWDWLAGQPGGASVTLRKLVEAARRQQSGGEERRQAQESAYRFMSAMAGNAPGFEEASRALFAGDGARFTGLIAAWPRDLRDHIATLAAQAFAAQ